MHQEGVHIGKMFQVLKQNYLNISKITLIFCVIALIYCFVATPIFTANTIINPPKLNNSGNSIAKNLGDMSDMDFSYSWSMTKTDADTIIAICKTDQLRNLIVDKFNLMKIKNLKNQDLARKYLSGVTTFTPDLKSGFLKISVDDSDPKLAANIANYYITALGQTISNIFYSKTRQKQKFFLEQLDITKANLHAAQDKLELFAEKNGVASGQQAAVVADLSTQLQAQLVVVRSQLQAMSLYATPDNPDYKNLQATVNSLEKQVNDVNGKNITSSDNMQLPIPSHLAPALSSEYSNLERDVLLNEEILKILFKQYENSKIEGYSQMVPSSIEVIDPALVPTYKSKPKKLKLIAIAFLLGIVLSSLYYIIKNKNKFIVEF